MQYTQHTPDTPDTLDTAHMPVQYPLAVMGLGLIGGSLVEAAAERNVPLLGYDPAVGSGKDFPGKLYEQEQDFLFAAQQQHAIIVVATPFPALSHVFTQINEHTEHLLITDVVSVKYPVEQLAEECGIGNRFLGGHPMAGTEKSGWNARDSRLFCGKKWVFTGNYSRRDYAHSSEDVREDSLLLAHKQQVFFRQLITQIGAIPVDMSATDHDHAVAAISHLPHIFAEILADTAHQLGDTALEIAAGSFADGTRVAATRPALVQAMIENNRHMLLPLISYAQEQLAQYYQLLTDQGNLEPLLHKGFIGRKRFEEYSVRVQE